MSSKANRKIFVLSAPSGGGKTTLSQRLLKRVPGLVRSVSMTTRQPRPGESDKRDYFFVSDAEFRKVGKARGFLEEARVFGCSYGTPRAPVERAMKRGNDVLLLIDVQGAFQVKRHFPASVLIFVMPPSIGELKSRLVKRSTETARDMQTRLRLARHEMKESRKYDYVIENSDLEKAASDLEAVITAERLRTNP